MVNTPQLGPRYLALYPLAAGGMAEVWIGAQKVAATQRPVAIKRILPQFAEDPKYVSMFLDEAHLAACIDSPNVVSIIDADVAEDGAPFLVMELIEGLSLAAMLKAKTGSMSVGMICYLIQQAADGLHDAHEARAPSGELLELVHRDVSPQNLLIGIDGRVRLADFGVARALERMTQTMAGEFKGKLNYCAPEQLHGNVDRRADIFSLGVVIRQALSGEGLFGRSSSSAEAIRKLLDKEIQPTGEVLPDIDPVLAAAIDKAIARNRALRYSSAAEFAVALAPFADASRTSLGRMVETMGGAPLKAQRDKTAEIFGKLRDEPSSSFAEVGARMLTQTNTAVDVNVDIKADSPVLECALEALPNKRSSRTRIVLVVALAAGIGAMIGLVDGGNSGEEHSPDPQQPEVAADESPQRTPEPAGNDEGPVLSPSPQDVVVEESAADPAPTLRGHERARGSMHRGNRSTRARQTGAEASPNTTNDPVNAPDEAEATSTPSPTDMGESTSMSRADRLQRDVF